MLLVSVLLLSIMACSCLVRPRGGSDQRRNAIQTGLTAGIARRRAQDLRERAKAEKENRKQLVQKRLIPIEYSSPDLEQGTKSSANGDQVGEDDEAHCCAICFEPYQPGESVAKATSHKCRHEFHYKCVADWLVRTPDCPICRQAFLKVDEEEEELKKLKKEQEERSDNTSQASSSGGTSPMSRNDDSAVSSFLDLEVDNDVEDSTASTGSAPRQQEEEEAPHPARYEGDDIESSDSPIRSAMAAAAHLARDEDDDTESSESPMRSAAAAAAGGVF